MIDQYKLLIARYEKLSAEERLENLMTLSIDPLTRFFPRHVLFQEISARVIPKYLNGIQFKKINSVLDRLQKEKETTFAMFDVRLLKQANGLPGLYKNGDLMIQIVTKSLQLAGFDIMGKMGGDEFLLVAMKEKYIVEEMCTAADNLMINNWKIILSLQDEGELSSNNFAIDLCNQIREAKLKFENGEIREGEIPCQTVDGIPVYADHGLVSISETADCLEKLLQAGWYPEETRLLSKVLIDVSLSIAEIRLSLAKIYNKALLLYEHYHQGEKVYKKAKDFIVSRGSVEGYVFPTKAWEAKDLNSTLENYVVMLVTKLLIKKHSGSVYEKTVTQLALSEWLT
jgi:GGDEF domain-containing protein